VSKRPVRFALGLGIFALTTACGAREEADGRAFAYRCEDGRYIVAHYRDPTDEVWLFLPGETVRLPHVPAASGAKYSDGATTLH
jgi:membrane-bound inhibitor of C-type lysozyme